jgi:hypothetical protein
LPKYSRILKKIRGVSQCGLVAIYIEKSIFKAKEEENYGNSIISPCKKYTLQKNPLKETNLILQAIITLELISSFNIKAKIYHFSKILI